jgi:dihydroxyacetone kinase-like predicted kinase
MDTAADDCRKVFADLGDSLVVAGDSDNLRVHIHTTDPGAALSVAVRLGRLRDVSVRNMDDQYEAAARVGAADDSAAPGIIAFATGDGFASVLESLGVVVRLVGPTSGSRLEETVRKALAASTETSLIVVPGDAAVAEAVRKVSPTLEATLHTIAAADMARAIAAVLAFQFGAPVQRNVESMNAAAASVTTLRGDTLDDVRAAVQALQEHQSAAEIVTVYFGHAADEDEANAVASTIAETLGIQEGDTVYGGQTDCRFLISID